MRDVVVAAARDLAAARDDARRSHGVLLAAHKGNDTRLRGGRVPVVLEFDLAFEVATAMAVEAGGGVKLAVFQAGSDAEGQASASALNRVRFKLDAFFDVEQTSS